MMLFRLPARVIVVCLLMGGGLFLPVAAEPSFPVLTGRVVDEAGVLDQASRNRIDSVLAAHENRTGNQVVVVTLKLLGEYDISDYGFRLGRHWAIGEAGKNNGAILLIAIEDRKIRIEVGYGLEGLLTDARSKQIIEEIIKPYLKAGKIPEGLVNGAQAIVNVLEENPVTEGVQKPPKKKSSPDWLGIIIIIIIIYLVTRRSGYTGGRGGFTGGMLGGSLGGWGGGSGSGWGGGGGFSGGGGSFGGGGASGNW